MYMGISKASCTILLSNPLIYMHNLIVMVEVCTVEFLNLEVNMMQDSLYCYACGGNQL